MAATPRIFVERIPRPICAHRFALGMIALVVGVVPAFSAGQSAFDGVYIARGVDSAGNEYRRAVDIERHGDRFTVTWVAAEVVGQAVILEPTWVGVGIATGDTLSVSFVAEDAFGIMVYEFGGDGQVSGRWTLAGEDETIYSETLTRLPDVMPIVTSGSAPAREHEPSLESPVNHHVR
jgi:hypothetical protein